MIAILSIFIRKMKRFCKIPLRLHEFGWENNSALRHNGEEISSEIQNVLSISDAIKKLYLRA